MENNEKPVAQSKHQLTKAYNVSYLTLQRWLEPIKEELGEYRGRAYTPKQVQMIYDLLGRP
ncbi:hypothetical protein [Plebeiibacterium sediminum]|uniref:DUF4248 domain-containing protein n=1 Tax=Plebeiibacterium sediminum TaxID=2992112 RepID=A0AAE3SGH8_9BACT|nr:hypothetical protein [Plebeiobacterium sediminum]MCW3788503.1 DUF4248 domain-containing protein [Plebeiobacterium sediminum]